MAKDDWTKYGPGTPTPTPESMTGTPGSLIPGFMRPSPETGMPGAFEWAGAWKEPAGPAGTGLAKNTGEYPENQPGSLYGPTPFAPAPGAPIKPAAVAPGPAKPVSPTDEMRAKLEGAVNPNTGLLPARFFEQNPEFAGGTMQVREGMTQEDIARLKRAGWTEEQINARNKENLVGKIYSLIEPSRQTQIENTMRGATAQWKEALGRMLPGMTSEHNLAQLGSTIASLTTAASGAAKTPAEISKLQAQAQAERARALEGPARTEELLSRAQWYRRDPSEHGQNIGTMMTNIYTHFMTEKAALLKDPFFLNQPPDQQRKILDDLEKTANQGMTGVEGMMRKPGMGGQGLQPGQRIKINPADGKHYIVDEKTNQVITEFK